MLAKTSFVDMGTGGVGIISGIKSERSNTTRLIPTKTIAGLGEMLATIKNTRLAPSEKIAPKMRTSVTGSGLNSGEGTPLSATIGIPSSSVARR
jgi:hypothetical protein